MEFIDINVSQEEINRHRYPPAVDEVKLGVEVGAQPKLSWRRITALGFGRPDEASTDDKVETAIAASLLVSASQPFSVLVESYDGCMAYSIGMTDEMSIERSLAGAFGTVHTEAYTPRFNTGHRLRAVDFCLLSANQDELGKNRSALETRPSCWVDIAARELALFSGQVRIDFNLLSEADRAELTKQARSLCDDIAVYLDSGIQTGDNLSVDTRDNIFGFLQTAVSGDTRYNKSSNASLSWKGVDSRLAAYKQRAEYLASLYDSARGQGWVLSLSVTADLGEGRILSAERDRREEALSGILTLALRDAGYGCVWARDDISRSKEVDLSLSEATARDAERPLSEATARDTERPLSEATARDAERPLSEATARDAERPLSEATAQNIGLPLPAAQTAQIMSFPTMSFPGFERVRNQYYNINLPDLGKSVDFAELMQYDRPTDIRLRLPERELNRHVFISGMTGSGKTNTVHHLLSVMGDFPYLVIEPVKGEYHSLPGVKSYTLTAGSDKSLCLNPFWFPRGASLQYHIDYLKQIISSAFDLYAAMPNILEQCLIRVYQHCGWDFIKNTNRYQALLDDELLYPTFSDLCAEVDRYLNDAKFGDELKGNYRGALLSRLQSFTSGPKGTLLNTPRHLDCDELGGGRVVISLDSLADDADKSIIMGVIIAQYFEYLKVKSAGSTKKRLSHLVVIEEAHHLFARGESTPSADGANESQALIKTLNNMLAEIRAYGEGFIIVDQSPSALHPSVIKNTGVKIAHRVDYGHDIEELRTALLLDDSDRELAALLHGQALIHFGGMRSPAKAQVPPVRTKEESVILEREEIGGSSVVSALLDDTVMSEFTAKVIVERVINHLLYDRLDNCNNIYIQLLDSLKATMIRLGHAELTSELAGGTVLCEYLSAMLPERLSHRFIRQYCLVKQITMYIKRFLTLVSESEGKLSRAELDALAGYRASQLEPRILAFYEYTDIAQYRSARAQIGRCVELGLVCDLTADLQKLRVKPETLESDLAKLLTRQYFFSIPADAAQLSARVIALLSAKRIYEENGR